MQKYKEFIDQNAAYLKARVQEASKKNFMVFGFPNSSTKEAFQNVIEKRDIYLLPFCLYLIHFGFGVSQDKQFTSLAFENLLPDSKSYEEMPFLAYICAYCNKRDGKLELSEDIIKHLADKNFPPALTTLGDLAVRQKNGYAQAKKCYLNSANQGHYIAKTRYIRLFDKQSKLLLRFKLYIGMLFKIFKNQARGEKYVYLDFYGVQK